MDFGLALGGNGLYENTMLIIWKMSRMRTAIQAPRSEVVAALMEDNSFQDVLSLFSNRTGEAMQIETV